MMAGPTRGPAYVFGPARCVVEVHADSVARWIDEFFTPSFEQAPARDDDLVVRFTSSDEHYDTLERRAVATAGAIPCFALDRRIVTLPGWRDAEATVAADERNRCCYRIHDSGVEIVGRSGAFRVRLGVLRIVRELLMVRRHALSPLLDMHAAAFESGGRAVLLAGGKRSGKTTLLCHALSSAGARLIANDRVVLDLSDRESVACGVPTLISIRPDTRARWTGLQNAGGYPSPRDTGQTDDARGAARSDRDWMSPSAFARALGSTNVSGAPLTTVVFPEIDPDADGWTIVPLSHEEATPRLAACRYGARQTPADRTIFDEVFGSPLARDHSPAETTQALVRHVRFFRCRLGPRAYDGKASEWLGALGHPVGSAVVPISSS